MIAAKLLLPPIDAPYPALVVRIFDRSWAIPLPPGRRSPMSRSKDARPFRLGRPGKGFPSHLWQDAVIVLVFLLIAIKWD